jgi:DNA helicase-4
MTNEAKAGKLSILKCDQCRDGYLIVKPTKDDNYFLGCTNYKRDGTGCGKVIWKQQYYDMLNLPPDPEPVKKFTRESAVVSRNTSNKKPTEQSNTSVVIKKANVKLVNYNENDLNDIVHTVLQCLTHISTKRFYGITILTDVLRGVQNERIADAKLDMLPEYGKLKLIKREDIVAIIEWLIENHFILQTKGQYPVLHPTYEGMHYDEKVTERSLKKLQGILYG